MFGHKWKELALFQADAQYKALKALANLEGQLHAHYKLEGGENCDKETQTTRHWEP